MVHSYPQAGKEALWARFYTEAPPRQRRSDYAAAAVLTGKGHENSVLELGGVQPYTRAQLAIDVSKQTGEVVQYNNPSESEYQAILSSFLLPILAECSLEWPGNSTSQGAWTSFSEQSVLDKWFRSRRHDDPGSSDDWLTAHINREVYRRLPHSNLCAKALVDFLRIKANAILENYLWMLDGRYILLQIALQQH